MSDTTANAFITKRKGTCYLTIKINRRNFDIMKIRQYKIDPDDKRRMRRLYPDVAFDWKKITAQLAQKSEECRSYRSRRRSKARQRRNPNPEPFIGVFDPFSGTAYVNDSDNIAGSLALLDIIVASQTPIVESDDS